MLYNISKFSFLCRNPFKPLVLNDDQHAVNAWDKLITIKKLWGKLESLRVIVCKPYSLIHSKNLHFREHLVKATG